MKKLGLILLLVCGFATISNAQLTIEEQVADSACACLNLVDSAKIMSTSNAVKMQCFTEALTKNQEAIMKNYKTEQRKEEDIAKAGIGGSLLIKVENVLAKDCDKYVFLQQYIQSYRASSKAAEKMQEKK